MSLSHWRLPLPVSMRSLINFVVFTESNKGLAKFQLVARNGASSTRKCKGSLLIIRAGLSGKVCSLTHVSSEDNQVKVLVDVVHDLHLEEGLGSIVHDLVAKL